MSKSSSSTSDILPQRRGENEARRWKFEMLETRFDVLRLLPERSIAGAVQEVSTLDLTISQLLLLFFHGSSSTLQGQVDGLPGSS